MKHIISACFCVLLFTGCATHNHQREAAAKGALIGAASGAIVSSITGGDPWEGAAAGAAAGAALGFITADGKQRRIERDRYGRRYWIDDHGRYRYLDN